MFTFKKLKMMIVLKTKLEAQGQTDTYGSTYTFNTFPSLIHPSVYTTETGSSLPIQRRSSCLHCIIILFHLLLFLFHQGSCQK